MRLRPVIIAAALLVLAGCGGEQTVAPLPQTVIGSVPKQTAPATTSTTPSGGGATTTTSGGASGKALFTSNGCVSCHTYAPAGSKSSIGPDLDKLAQYAKTAKQPLASFTRESIVKPNAYVQPGFPPNVMPTSFASLPKSQVDALVSFLTKGH